MASNEAEVPSPPIRFGVVLFPVFELLDVAGPLEALNVLTRLPNFSLGSKITLSIIAETLIPVSTGSKGAICQQSISPTHTFDEPPSNLEVLIVPGGFGAGHRPDVGEGEPVGPLVAFIKKQYPSLRYLFTVCSGSGLAARAGVLDGLEATTNKVSWTYITPFGDKTYWKAQARWVVSGAGKVWTTSGVSAGTDGFLAWMKTVYGAEVAEATAARMEYTMVVDSSNDPWALVHKREDVIPAGWDKKDTK